MAVFKDLLSKLDEILIEINQILKADRIPADMDNLNDLFENQKYFTFLKFKILLKRDICKFDRISGLIKSNFNKFYINRVIRLLDKLLNHSQEITEILLSESLRTTYYNYSSVFKGIK
ncbi:hypothetical protein RF11_06398 [Thelohanellus kitauei]|uniref:Uncharacterized protein n=1 Tax=Thelohanellus kitauei TaxID=669202 RepID=A0A0C2IWJ3_THEKT|nr:hypothetical protein RF11_06398 [Thelohanellus kitauei]